jgi:hypothetical protein
MPDDQRAGGEGRMAEDVPLDVALNCVLAAAIDSADRQALLTALHRERARETAAAGRAVDPALDDEIPGGAVVLAFTPRRGRGHDHPPAAA